MGLWARMAMGATLAVAALIEGQAHAAAPYRLSDAAYASYNAINEALAGMPAMQALQCENLRSGEQAWKTEESRLLRVRNGAAGESPRIDAAINVLAARLQGTPAVRDAIERQGLDSQEYASFGVHYALAENAIESFGSAVPACDAQHWSDAASAANCRFVAAHRGEQHAAPLEVSAPACDAAAAVQPGM